MWLRVWQRWCGSVCEGGCGVDCRYGGEGLVKKAAMVVDYGGDYGFDEEEQGVNCRLKIADGVMVMAV